MIALAALRLPWLVGWASALAILVVWCGWSLRHSTTWPRRKRLAFWMTALGPIASVAALVLAVRIDGQPEAEVQDTVSSSLEFLFAALAVGLASAVAYFRPFADYAFFWFRLVVGLGTLGSIVLLLASET